MKPATVLPAFAAVTCLEFALVFLALYLMLGRRPENLAATALSALLAAMIACALMLQTASDPQADLCWYRVHYLSVYALIAVLMHFLSLLTRRPLPRPLASPRLYLLAGALWLPAFLPGVLHRVPVGTPPIHFDDATWGPWYPLYAGLPLGAGCVACGVAVWARRPPPALGGRDAGFAPLEAEVRGVALAALAVLLAGVVEFVQQVCFPRVNVPVSPRAAAAVAFCAVMAWALVGEVRRGEERRQRLALEMRRSEDLARARLQATYDAQHQVKNSLASIELPLRNALRAMQRGEGPAPQARVADALGEVRRLFQTLDVMLNAARLAAGEPPQLGPKRAGDAAALVQSACERRAAWERERRTAEGDGDRPAWAFDFEMGAPPPIVFLHPDALEQVLAVLLDNAVKFSPRGGPVTLRLWAEDDRLRLSVSDQGVGIAPGDLEQISARPFFRGPPGEFGIAGTGLGLYLARRLVESQGGRLWAESVVGTGSTFHVSLPLEPGD